jgi:hypothetical protein
MRPTEADMIQKIQDLKVDQSRLRKRAQAAEMLLLDIINAHSTGATIPEHTVMNARSHIMENQSQWRSGL